MDTSLLLIRHAETVWNREGRMQGFQDSPLSENGTAQAEALGRRLRAMRVDAVISSDAPRCVRTARIAVGELSLPLRTTPALRERNLGAWEGRTWADIAAENPAGAQTYRATADYRPPDGESFLEVRDRVTAALQAAAEEFAERRILVFTSGGSVRGGLLGLMNIPADTWGRYAIWNTGVTRFDFRKGLWRLVQFNDVAHLPGTADGPAVF
jgi:broad specificity phosphatase PhoE